jgi:hypothetical protein
VKILRKRTSLQTDDGKRVHSAFPQLLCTTFYKEMFRCAGELRNKDQSYNWKGEDSSDSTSPESEAEG